MDVAEPDASPSELARPRTLAVDGAPLDAGGPRPDKQERAKLRARLTQLGPYGLVAVGVVPSIGWIVRDHSVWPFDQAWYGEISVMLYAALVKTPTEWPSLMLQAFGIKAPGIAWIGQFFVPIGAAIGSIELGLLASILIVQVATLCVLLGAYRAQAGSRLGPALVGCLVVAASPLFVAMSHQYFVEPLQNLAVAWFIAIMTFAPRWRRSTLLANLVGASAFALLAKVSSPLYCLGPGLIGVWLLFGRRAESVTDPWYSRPRIVLGLIAAFGLAVVTAGWYLINHAALVNFVLSTSSGPVAEFFGVHESFPAKLLFWLAGTQHSFFSPGQLVALAFIIGLAGFLSVRQRLITRAPLRSWPAFSTACAVVAFGQVVLVLCVFSFQVNEEQRYLLPLAPYLGLLVALSLAKLDLLRVTQLTGAVLIFQWAAVYAQALGVTGINSDFTYWLLSPHGDRRDFDDVEAAVTDTCAIGDAGRYNIVGVELGWFNANSFSFFDAKHFASDNPRCFYTSLGFAESDPTRAWDRMLALNVDYFVTIDPVQSALNDDSFNRVSLPMLERVRTSPLFVAEPFPSHPRVLILKHTQ